MGAVKAPIEISPADEPGTRWDCISDHSGLEDLVLQIFSLTPDQILAWGQVPKGGHWGTQVDPDSVFTLDKPLVVGPACMVRITLPGQRGGLFRFTWLGE